MKVFNQINDQQNFMNIFYPRSIISLLIMLSFIKSKKNDKNKNILILEKVYFDKFIKISLNQDLLYNYFKIVKIISTPETTHKIFSYNYLKLYFYNNQIVNKIEKLNSIKNLLKIECKNFYGAGSYLDEIFFRKNVNAKFYFVEHGVGNIYQFSTNNIFKARIHKLLKNILNFIFSNKSFKYYGYLGILNKKFTKSIYINHKKVEKNLTINLLKFKEVLNEFLLIYKKNKKLKKKNKKNYILFNWNYLIKPKSDIIAQMIKKHKINFRKDIFIIKAHNKDMYNNDKNYNLLIKILNENKIKFNSIDNKFSFMPLEYMIYHFNIKKIISLMSSTPFYLSIIFPKIKIIFYYSLNKEFNKKYFFPEHTNLALRTYKNKFKNISFF